VPAADPGRRPVHLRPVRLLDFVADGAPACDDPGCVGQRLAWPEPIALFPPDSATAFGPMPQPATREILRLGGSGGTSCCESMVHLCLGPARADPRRGPALDIHQLDLALSAGRHAVERAKLAGIALVAARGAGPGEHTAALALACAIAGAAPHAQGLGAASGTSAGGFAGDPPDLETVRASLVRHAGHLADPYEALRRVGSLELAALVGTCLACAQLGILLSPLGYPARIAAVAARGLNPDIGHWLIGCASMRPPKEAEALAGAVS
jgi:nicotinate-nucleotide--dimethylbenzimidazole phosphoribosyltransferase